MISFSLAVTISAWIQTLAGVTAEQSVRVGPQRASSSCLIQISVPFKANQKQPTGPVTASAAHS